MYARITEHEIVLPSKGSQGTSRGAGETQGMRLAAAVGLTQLLLPFRYLMRTLRTLQAWEKWECKGDSAGFGVLGGRIGAAPVHV